MLLHYILPPVLVKLFPTLAQLQAFAPSHNSCIFWPIKGPSNLIPNSSPLDLVLLHNKMDKCGYLCENLHTAKSLNDEKLDTVPDDK